MDLKKQSSRRGTIKDENEKKKEKKGLKQKKREREGKNKFDLIRKSHLHGDLIPITDSSGSSWAT